MGMDNSRHRQLREARLSQQAEAARSIDQLEREKEKLTRMLSAAEQGDTVSRDALQTAISQLEGAMRLIRAAGELAGEIGLQEKQ